jgi:hypothetical protein
VLPILTYFTRALGGLLGSNSNSMLETWGNRPSRAGYWETEFSRASRMAFPFTLMTTQGSSNGKLVFC